MSGATIVLGLGNVAQADDGLGIHAVRELLARYHLPPEVEVIEGGTAGLLLVPVLSDADRAVIVDAIDLGAMPGDASSARRPGVVNGFPAAIHSSRRGALRPARRDRPRRRAARRAIAARRAAGANRLGL